MPSRAAVSHMQDECVAMLAACVFEAREGIVSGGVMERPWQQGDSHSGKRLLPEPFQMPVS